MKSKLLLTFIIAFMIVIPSFSIIENRLDLSIKYVLENSYMKLDSNGKFNGSKYITKNELAEILYNIDKSKQTRSDMIESIYKNTVIINSNNSVASGTLINEYFILTCSHFYKEGNVYAIYNGFVLDCEIIKIDKEKDLCLLKLREPIKDTKFIKFNFKPQKLGEEIFTIGHPYNTTNSVSYGYVSNLNAYNLIQFDMNLNFGNSGGAIYNSKGELISIAVKKMDYKYGYGLSYGVKQDVLKSFLEENYYNNTSK